MRRILKGILICSALLLCGWIIFKPKPYKLATKEMMLDKSIGVEISPTQGIKVVVDDETDWSTTFQVLVIVLGTYGGIRVINKYTRA